MHTCLRFYIYRTWGRMAHYWCAAISFLAGKICEKVKLFKVAQLSIERVASMDKEKLQQEARRIQKELVRA